MSKQIKITLGLAILGIIILSNIWIALSEYHLATIDISTFYQDQTILPKAISPAYRNWFELRENRINTVDTVILEQNIQSDRQVGKLIGYDKFKAIENYHLKKQN